MSNVLSHPLKVKSICIYRVFYFNIVFQVAQEDQSSISELVYELTKNSKNQLEKARYLFLIKSAALPHYVVNKVTC